MTSSPTSKYSSQPNYDILELRPLNRREPQAWLFFGIASFLVSVPVFFQAPIVRLFPFLSLALTIVWVIIGWLLYRNKKTHYFGDIILGFSWSWLAGSIYWGWFRSQPIIHIPIESIGLPFAIWCLWKGWGKVGNYFYLGSLIGTAITDLYFWLTGLIPYWIKIMEVEPEMVSPIFKSALLQIQNPWGISWAIVLVNILLGISLWSLNKPQLHWWAFAGAVMSTILVDSLFWVAAYFC